MNGDALDRLDGGIFVFAHMVQIARPMMWEGCWPSLLAVKS